MQDDLLWAVSWLLCVLTRLAERDETLAAVGLAHLCFLLPLLAQPHPASWSDYDPFEAGFRHNPAIRAYRRHVKTYREQGKSYEEAQRLALAGMVR